MPPEPEKRIEPLLKAYAEKRRQAAEGQPGLHPVNRRLLQSEARKRWPATPAGGDSHSPRWYQKILTFWPRLVMAGAIAVVLGMGLWILGPANNPVSTHVAKQDSAPRSPAKPSDEIVFTSTGARNEPSADSEVDRLNLAKKPSDAKKMADGSGVQEQKLNLESISQRGVADQPAPTPNLALPMQTKAKEVVPPATAPPAEPSLAAAPRPASAPVPPSRVGGRLVETVQRESQVLNEEARVNRSRYVTLAPTSNLETASRPFTAATYNESSPARPYYFRNLSTTPPASFAPLAAGAAGAGGPAGGAGAGAESRRSRLDRSGNAPAGPAAGVLVNFAVEQRGRALRIIDEDGSVYEGQVLADAEPAVAAQLRKPVALKREAPEPRPTPVPDPSKSISETSALAASADKNSASKDADGVADASRPQLAFEVSGTNKTLRQSISLAGTLYFSSTNLLVVTNTARFQQGLGVVTLNDQYTATRDAKEQASTNISQVLRILGRGRVNGSNEVSVDAVPAPR